ncbi:MAG: hypothetical protein D6785_10870 [Planctomycetota bacterium]|nr:MAG: hypothetical protein D6785_10870 [Planctomycetota bacterium]
MVQRKAEIPIEFPTKQAEKDLQKTEGLFKKTFGVLRKIEERSGIFSTFGIAGTTAVSQIAFQSQFQSRASSTLEAGSSAIQAGGTALGGLLGGIPGALIGNLIGNIVQGISNAIREEINAVKDKSLSDIQGIAAQFAEVGVSLSDEAIKQLLKEREQINQRVFDAVSRVKQIQDAQTKTIDVLLNAASRKLSQATSALGF